MVSLHFKKKRNRFSMIHSGSFFNEVNILRLLLM